MAAGACRFERDLKVLSCTGEEKEALVAQLEQSAQDGDGSSELSPNCPRVCVHGFAC